MITYLDALTLSLMNIYRMGLNEAKYLSWGGLQGTIAYQVLPSFIVNGTNSTSGILYTNTVYKTGEKGTLCVPL